MSLSLYRLCTLPYLAIAVFCTRSQAQATPATTSAMEVSYAKAAEADPLSPMASSQRAAAMQYAENDHSSHVLLCQQLFEAMQKDRGADAEQVRLQYVISAAGYLYENPDQAANSLAQNLAGLRAAIHVYGKIVSANPKAHYKFLDTMAQHERAGDLEQALQKLCK